jgi:hypothetical protein
MIRVITDRRRRGGLTAKGASAIPTQRRRALIPALW